MADKKVTELTSIANVSGDDLLLVVNDPLGTPSSRKVTIKGFFSDVDADVVFTKNSSFTGNTTFTGTTVTFSANVDIQGTPVKLAINDRMQVANVEAYLANTNSWLTSSNNAINDRMQVANVEAMFIDPVTSGNVVFDRLLGNRIYGLILPIDVNGPVSTNAALENTFAMDEGGKAIPKGTFWLSNSHIYVATSENDIKRTRISHLDAAAYLEFREQMVGEDMAFQVVGGGATGEPNEPITLYKGLTYEFRTSNENHVTEIRNSVDGDAYSNGVVYTDGQQFYFTVPQNQVSNLVYQCTQHAEMVGTLVIK